MKSVKIDLDSLSPNMTISQAEQSSNKIDLMKKTDSECIRKSEESNMESDNGHKMFKPTSVPNTFSQQNIELIQTNTEVAELQVELHNCKTENHKTKNECNINLFSVFKNILKYSMLNSVFISPNRVSAVDDYTEVTQSCELVCNFNSSNINETRINGQEYCENNYCENYAEKYFEDHVDDYCYENYDNFCKMNLDHIDVNSEKSTVISLLADQQSLVQYDKAAFFKTGKITDNLTFNDCKEYIIK